MSGDNLRFGLREPAFLKKGKITIKTITSKKTCLQMHG